jgi:serine/threonine protein kinase
VQDDSEIVLVRDSVGGEYRMAKKVRLAEGGEESLLNEVSLLKQLDHPHVLRYHDIHLEDDQLVSILEFC